MDDILKKKRKSDFCESLALVYSAEKSVRYYESDKAPSVEFLGHSVVSCRHTVIVL